MSKASAYLEASWSRCADRGVLVRRETDMVFETLGAKQRFLKDLLSRIERHRREDLEQLSAAREDTWATWSQRLGRMVEWRAAAAPILNTSNYLEGWRQGLKWFDRAAHVQDRYAHLVARKMDRWGRESSALLEKRMGWSERILHKAMELDEFLDRRQERTSEILVTYPFKRGYLDFLFKEKEIEGQLNREMKRLSGSATRELQTLARVEEHVSKKADANPAYFEVRKRQLLDANRPIRDRLSAMAQGIDQQSAPYEESRQRLRGIYEAVQKMRAVEKTTSTRRPLLSRLFNLQDD